MSLHINAKKLYSSHLKRMLDRYYKVKNNDGQYEQSISPKQMEQVKYEASIAAIEEVTNLFDQYIKTSK